jgi:hypothetical protein
MPSDESPPNPPLVERDFLIEQDGAMYRITARAVYFEPAFNQPYTLIITCKGTDLEMSQPDERHYSRDEAQVAAGRLFASGFVERYIRENLKSWIFLSSPTPSDEGSSLP